MVRHDVDFEAVTRIAAGLQPDGGASFRNRLRLCARNLAVWSDTSKTWELTERGKRLAELGWV